MAKIKRKRFISETKLSREQAQWLCRAILTHYRSDGGNSDGERDNFDVFNRVHRTGRYKRGRDWAIHPIGYDLREVWYGSERSGFREAWAALVALPISQGQSAPQEHRTYSTYGLIQGYQLSIAVYHITEVTASAPDESFLNYVFQCFSRLMEDVQEAPEYNPKGNHNQRR